MWVSGMPTLPKNKDYQVWLMNGKHLESVGVFHPKGHEQLILKASKPVGRYKRIGIMQEPAGWSPQPTTRQILSSDLSI